MLSPTSRLRLLPKAATLRLWTEPSAERSELVLDILLKGLVSKGTKGLISLAKGSDQSCLELENFDRGNGRGGERGVGGHNPIFPFREPWCLKLSKTAPLDYLFRTTAFLQMSVVVDALTIFTDLLLARATYALYLRGGWVGTIT